MKGKKKIPTTILYIINLALFLVSAYLIVSHKLFPTNLRKIFIAVGTLFQILVLVILWRSLQRGGKNIVIILLLFISIIFNGVFIGYARPGLAALEHVTSVDGIEQTDFSIITGKNSRFKTLEDLKDVTISAPIGQDGFRIEKYREMMRGKLGRAPEFVDGGSYVEEAKKILANPDAVVLLNESYRDLISEQFPRFNEMTKVIDSRTVKYSVEEEEKPKVQKEEPFIVYISGIDTYGSIENTSLSDVNILMTVNPDTGKILLTTIPRDSYVRIAGGGKDEYDKLTHSGIYGVQSSMATVENLFGIHIDYYVKVNFTSLVRIVDDIGGITVENPQSFSSEGGKYRFPKGMIDLNGKQALIFSRERHSLKEGDIDRGKNHLKVVKALIQKATTPAILKNYTDVMKVAMESVETNMPKDKIIELVNFQLATGTNWKTEETNITGEGRRDLPSYAMPGYRLYMMKVDEESARQVKSRIMNTLNGE